MGTTTSELILVALRALPREILGAYSLGFRVLINFPLWFRVEGKHGESSGKENAA